MFHHPRSTLDWYGAGSQHNADEKIDVLLLSHRQPFRSYVHVDAKSVVLYAAS